MYVQQIHHYPAPGKGPELRALLEDWAKTAPSRGFSHNLVSQILGPHGPDFINGIRHDDLTAFGSYPQRSSANPAFAGFTAKQQPLLGRPNEMSLYEILVPFSGGGEPPRYVYRVTWYPATGKAPAVRGLLEERVKSRQAAGARYALAGRVFSQEGPVFAINQQYQDLASLEAQLHSNRDDPDLRAFGEKIAPLVARPPKTELFQVLVPFPRG